LSNAAINEPKAAEAAFRKAMELAPREFAAYVALAQLMGARGDTKGALLVLATVADAAKKDPPLANALGMAYLGAKDYPAAEAAFRTALAVDSGYAEARLNLADTLALRGRYGDAVVEYQKLRQAEPKREDVALRLATTYEKMRRFDSAEKLLRELLSTDGGNVPSTRARAAAGRFWVRQNQIALAGEQVAPLFAADPRQPTGFYLRGVVLFFDGRIDEAIKDVTEAVQIEPQSEYWETLGRMQEKKGELAPAMASFNHAIQMDATFAAPHSGLGRLHLLRRDWDAALASFQRASTLDTLDASIWAGIAEARYGRRELPDAIKAYETAIEKNGKVGEYHFRVGKFLSENDQGALAIGRFARAISLGPDNASWIHDAYRLLGYAQKAAGHKAEACDAFNSYLRKAPPNDKLRDQVNRESLSCR
jgi:tetratricopeptide (TPR) repeat protein